MNPIPGSEVTPSQTRKDDSLLTFALLVLAFVTAPIWWPIAAWRLRH